MGTILFRIAALLVAVASVTTAQTSGDYTPWYQSQVYVLDVYASELNADSTPDSAHVFTAEYPGIIEAVYIRIDSAFDAADSVRVGIAARTTFPAQLGEAYLAELVDGTVAILVESGTVLYAGEQVWAYFQPWLGGVNGHVRIFVIFRKIY